MFSTMNNSRWRKSVSVRNMVQVLTILVWVFFYFLWIAILAQWSNGVTAVVCDQTENSSSQSNGSISMLQVHKSLWYHLSVSVHQQVFSPCAASASTSDIQTGPWRSSSRSCPRGTSSMCTCPSAGPWPWHGSPTAWRWPPACCSCSLQ